MLDSMAFDSYSPDSGMASSSGVETAGDQLFTPSNQRNLASGPIFFAVVTLRAKGTCFSSLSCSIFLRRRRNFVFTELNPSKGKSASLTRAMETLPSLSRRPTMASARGIWVLDKGSCVRYWRATKS